MVPEWTSVNFPLFLLKSHVPCARFVCAKRKQVKKMVKRCSWWTCKSNTIPSTRHVLTCGRNCVNPTPKPKTCFDRSGFRLCGRPQRQLRFITITYICFKVRSQYTNLTDIVTSQVSYNVSKMLPNYPAFNMQRSANITSRRVNWVCTLIISVVVLKNIYKSRLLTY